VFQPLWDKPEPSADGADLNGKNKRAL